ncbi:hypothetical protein TSMEX_004693 [Taenia solium]|eukprot:TsM_001078600 transcript=TsM_001078600 gene=TsM_001078600
MWVGSRWPHLNVCSVGQAAALVSTQCSAEALLPAPHPHAHMQVLSHWRHMRTPLMRASGDGDAMVVAMVRVVLRVGGSRMAVRR